MQKINPLIVLVRPQLPENIGMVARAMDNCGFDKLALVSPREKWPSNKAIKAAANSSHILKKIKVYKSLAETLSSYKFIIGTSNRRRFLQKPFENNFSKLFNNIPNKKIAILFGPENSGLSNDDLMLCDVIFKIDLYNNKSLNLSHAVLLFCYMWKNFFKINKDTNKIKSFKNSKDNLASKKDFNNFMKFLKIELSDIGFLHPLHKKKKMFNNIQTMLLRSALSSKEIKTLWGMIKKLRKS